MHRANADGPEHARKHAAVSEMENEQWGFDWLEGEKKKEYNLRKG